MKLVVNHHFQAAHQLEDSDDLVTKQCANLHGHSFKVKVIIDNQENDRHGMIIDFKAIKKVIDKLDHQFINEIFENENFNESATSENIGLYLKSKICNLGFAPEDVELWICEGFRGDTESCWVVV